MIEKLLGHPSKSKRLDQTVVPGKTKESECSRRLRFWEIDHSFVCPIAGLCLTFVEQKRIVKKVIAEPYGKTPYEIHEMVVGSSDGENPLSRKLDGFLGRRFAAVTRALHPFSEEAFMKHWREAFRKGEYRGALWAAGTRVGLSKECKREIYGTVHMAMHGTAEHGAGLQRELNKQTQKAETLSDRFKEEVRCKRTLQKEMAKLTRTLQQATSKLAVLEQHGTNLEDKIGRLENVRSVSNSENEHTRLESALSASEEGSMALEQQVALLAKRNRELIQKLQEQEALIADFERETQTIIEKLLQVHPCDTDCPSFDLCRKRILVVGGMTRLEAFYRRLIEGRGGIFEYHDGYMKKGARQLENQLKRADVVLCPVNCNSHAACSMVKNLCKKHEKPVYMMANSSLNAVSQAIIGSAP